ncbi:Ibr domain protein (macronuclear) [Tetrahymena thermophila SB210]|uniref:RBR-type E3 ubiquitin transferase n=1 Tax=Tetrahymena thermophila (strain SB210) TaxID=312017 RepID=Q22CY7_TETTS|nr:Ibr domain protein [Tetrahymena thermophila SB210]EAR83132.1 Ibr domain protein [Tetrahymena thermophila SB210]|eukprot:XP_001030795.1 Ibr domain protein [Tetrahymena thermophila SB210]
MIQGDSSSALIPSCHICMIELSHQRQFVKVCQDQNEICDDCLDSWISSQLSLKSTNSQREFIFMKCPFSTCKKLFDLESFLSKVDINKLPKTSNELFKNYCRETNSITNCPNAFCKNIGFINSEQTCRQNLQCDVCLYTWKLPSQKHLIEQIFNCISIFQSQNSQPGSQDKGEQVRKIVIDKYEELKTLIYKLIFSKSCTKCGISISRNGGCKQMRCEKCYHHFCWDCGQTINFRHQSVKCSVLQTIKISLLLSPVFAIYYKLGFFSFLKGISFTSILSQPNTVNLGCKLPQKMLGLIGLFIRIFFYHSPIKIIHQILLNIHKNFPNLMQNNILFAQLFQQKISKLKEEEEQGSNLYQRQKYIQILKWVLLLLGNGILLKQFGKGKEVLGILGIESLLSIFLITNHIV